VDGPLNANLRLQRTLPDEKKITLQRKCHTLKFCHKCALQREGNLLGRQSFSAGGKSFHGLATRHERTWRPKSKCLAGGWRRGSSPRSTRPSVIRARASNFVSPASHFLIGLFFSILLLFFLAA
jgi:hypothetical protein